MRTIEVAAALIQDASGRYLIAQRREGTHLAGMWEFPGGMREPGETLEQCLRRELIEELGAEFAVGEKVETVRWEYPDKIVLLHFYRCRVEKGTVDAREGQALEWVAADALRGYEFPPADLTLVERLQSS